MAETAIQIIRDAKRLCLNSMLGETLKRLGELFAQRPDLIGHERFEKIDDDYRRLLQFMMTGYNDPARDELYASLLRSTYAVCANLELSWLRRNDSAYSLASSTASGLNIGYDLIKTVLTSFVSDVAMLSLQDDNESAEEKNRLYGRHNVFMQRLFASIFVSYQWTKDDTAFFSDILTSPTIEPIDQQLITSAISLSCWNVFDIQKLLCLFNVYKDSIDTHVKQRALVGWVFAIDYDNTIYPEEKECIQALLADRSVRRDVEEMQLQVIMCNDAPADDKTIQDSIMPDIMKNAPVRVERGSIVEKDEDELTNILHPEQDDEAMQRVEESMNRIIDMQKQGADIYFGGFKMMKRFPFFQDIANWFMPFYIENPALSEVKAKVGDGAFFTNLLNNGPFCESDRYSFALAFNSVIDKLPQSMREMLSSTEALGVRPMSENEMKSASNVRRSYLQDLYRFFYVYPYRSALRDIFSTDTSLFINRLNSFSNNFRQGCFRIASFLLRRHKDKEALAIVCGLKPVKRNHYAVLLLLSITLKNKDIFEPYLNDIENSFSEDDELIDTCAKWHYTFGNYQHAIKLLKELNNRNDGNYDRELTDVLILSGNYSDALPLLYKAYYNTPTDDTSRKVAYALLQTGKVENAKKIYSRLVSSYDFNEIDLLRMAIIYLSSNDIPKTVEMLKRYIDKEKSIVNQKDLLEQMNNEIAKLPSVTIPTTTLYLVLDATLLD